jgi:hypothetical protein
MAHEFIEFPYAKMPPFPIRKLAKAVTHGGYNAGGSPAAALAFMINALVINSLRDNSRTFWAAVGKKLQRWQPMEPKGGDEIWVHSIYRENKFTARLRPNELGEWIHLGNHGVTIRTAAVDLGGEGKGEVRGNDLNILQWCLPVGKGFRCNNQGVTILERQK